MNSQAAGDLIRGQVLVRIDGPCTTCTRCGNGSCLLHLRPHILPALSSAAVLPPFPGHGQCSAVPVSRLLSDAPAAETISSYYRTVAPFYAGEMEARTDLTEWRSLASRLHPARILDLGCGGGRLARAVRAELQSAKVVGVDRGLELLVGPPDFAFVQGDMRALPFGRAFDLVAAANDPFAHLLDDSGRIAALREAIRILRPGGRVVIDGLWLTPEDIARARQGSLVRERALGRITLEERWRMTSADTYDTTYRYTENGRLLAEARAVVRAWSVDEPAIRGAAASVVGGLDGRPFDAAVSRLVVVAGGAP